MTLSKTTAAEFALHIPGDLVAVGKGAAWKDMLVEIYTRLRQTDTVIVPSVAEPLIVWVVSGTAYVEEREFKGSWNGRTVKPGDFFLTNTRTPYELRWKTMSPEAFQIMHAYVGLPIFTRALQEMHKDDVDAPQLREVFGETDSVLIALLAQLREELVSGRRASALFVQGIAQCLAAHLVRTYVAPRSEERQERGGLPAFKLRIICDFIDGHLGEKVALEQLAKKVGMSKYHFARMFKEATGLPPSLFLIRRRVARARLLLEDTTQTILEIGEEVGYASPSYFGELFRREVGVSPSEYRSRL